MATGPEFDGGDSSQNNGTFLLGGDGSDLLTPYSNPQIGLDQPYTLAGLGNLKFQRVGLTLSRSTRPLKLVFNNSAFKLINGADDIMVFDVSDFFDPSPEYGGYLKQNIDISPYSTFLLNSGNFAETDGEVDFLFLKATYSIEAADHEKVLSWTYKGQTNPMGKLMILSGAVKENVSWNGWDVEPYDLNPPNTGILLFPGITAPNYSLGGILITNPTKWSVNLKIITSV